MFLFAIFSQGCFRFVYNLNIIKRKMWLLQNITFKNNKLFIFFRFIYNNISLNVYGDTMDYWAKQNCTWSFFLTEIILHNLITFQHNNLDAFDVQVIQRSPSSKLSKFRIPCYILWRIQSKNRSLGPENSDWRSVVAILGKYRIRDSAYSTMEFRYLWCPNHTTI